MLTQAHNNPNKPLLGARKILFITTKFTAALSFGFFLTVDEFNLYNLCMLQVETVKNFPEKKIPPSMSISCME